MKINPVLLITALLLFTQALIASGQENVLSGGLQKEGELFPKFGAGFQFGTLSINDTNYNTFNFMPDFAIGRLEIGLDINFELEGNGNFRSTEWNSWQAILSKIFFIRYGQKDDPFYIKAGGISFLTIGDGFLMNRFSGILNYPSFKKPGLEMEMDFDIFGFQFMTDNLFDFDILGLRVFYRPLSGSDIPLFNKIELGAAATSDLDPLNPQPPTNQPYSFSDSPASTPVIVYGLDADIPLVDYPFLTLKTYSDFAGIQGKGTGELIGIGGSVVSNIPYNFGIRIIQPGFIPSYFDSFYETVRPSKYSMLDSLTDNYIGWQFGSGLHLFEKRLNWDIQVDSAFVANSNPSLATSFELTRDLFKLISIKMTWMRKNLTKFSDFLTMENANSILLFTLEYYLSDNLALSLDYKRTFQVNPFSGAIEPFMSTGFSSRAAF